MSNYVNFNKFKSECASNYTRLTLDGKIAVRVKDSWLSYDPESKDFIDVSLFNFDVPGCCYLLPSFDVAVGDILDTDYTCKQLAYVDEITADGKIIVVRYSDRIRVELRNESLQFMNGKKIYMKIVNLFGGKPMSDNLMIAMSMLGNGDDAASKNLLPLLLLNSSENEKSNKDILLFSMLSQQQNTNSLLPFLLLNDSNSIGGEDSESLKKMILLSNMGKDGGNANNLLPLLLLNDKIGKSEKD